MNLKPSHKFIKIHSIKLTIIVVFLFLSIQNFVAVKGHDFLKPSKQLSETNTLTSQIPLIIEELHNDKLSPQMRISLNEKLDLLQNYSDIVEKEEIISAIKDNNLIVFAPKVNDPPFQEGIFPGGNHLLTNPASFANNYFQTRYHGNYIQIVAGNNLVTNSGSLYMIITSSDKFETEIINISIPDHVHDLIIVSFGENYINLSDQDKQIYIFELETKGFFTEN